MADRRFLHSMAVYFGLAGETTEDRRARLEVPEPALLPLLLWCVVAGLLSGAIYGLLFTGAERGLLFGLVLGVVLFAMRVYERWRASKARRAEPPSG